MRVGKKDMMEWYIAPYYNSKEQYLYGYREDFWGEPIFTTLEKS